jgi:hypothetical protein
MPWTPDDAEGHTRKATTWELKKLWAKVANECLERTGDEGMDSRDDRDLKEAAASQWGASIERPRLAAKDLS